ncbi:uncharacterized protein LOC123865700 [Maniola jurtina]|uniref:uncharacterized protein LOC123865700 n=1 Tax=Maniola jurtina TaxID=191418 RepID=UPI001E68ABE7|nr:uncharacterized protein LOC123865700 [Maniola jurtina]
MNRYNIYMENLKRSKTVALGLIDETKDIIEGISVESPIKNIRLRSPNADVEISAPSTSRQENKRPTEYVKYGKITFNTTAILHHYPQMQNKNCADNCKVRHSNSMVKSDLNLSEQVKADNNNQSEIEETKVVVNQAKHNVNNNENSHTIKTNCVKSKPLEVLRKPVKFTEEKLV